MDNPCHSDPICNGHGSCSYGGTICHCLHGYSGDGCEIPPTEPIMDNPCHSDPICNGHGSCSRGETVCNCLHGYTGDGCEILPMEPNIDNPCTSNPICNGHGSCSQGGTVCDCLHGYTGNGCEIPPISTTNKTDYEDFDPHTNETHCVDVSTYTYPEWVRESRNCCSTEFVKKTHKIWKEVCMNVTSLYCDVW